MHRQTRTYDSRCAKDASHQVARQETGGRTHTRTRTPKSFVRYSGKMGRRTDRTGERADREREREARSNILMTKYEMTFGFGGGKAGTKQRTSTRWRGTLNSRGAPRALYGTPIDRMGTDDDETTMSTLLPPPRNVLISLCYLLRQLKRRRS